jgi:hypothetical protein
VPPDRYLTFLEVPPFPARWDSFQLPESDLIALQAILMADPQAGDVVPGSGGYRKLRFAPPSWLTGKRGALRVYYLPYPRYGVVLLNAIYAKNERADLSAAQKKSLARLAATFETLLQRAAEVRRPKQ